MAATSPAEVRSAVLIDAFSWVASYNPLLIEPSYLSFFNLLQVQKTVHQLTCTGGRCTASWQTGR